MSEDSSVGLEISSRTKSIGYALIAAFAMSLVVFALSRNEAPVTAKISATQPAEMQRADTLIGVSWSCIVGQVIIKNSGELGFQKLDAGVGVYRREFRKDGTSVTRFEDGATGTDHWVVGSDVFTDESGRKYKILQTDNWATLISYAPSGLIQASDGAVGVGERCIRN